MTAASERASGRRLERFDLSGVDLAEIEELAFHKPFDAILHAEYFVDFGIGVLLTEFEAALNDAAKTGIDDAGRTAALADNRIALEHGESPDF